jgi:hypothetical protein
MPNYEVTIKVDSEGMQTARGAAEGACLHLLTDMFYGSLTVEVKDRDTGNVETIELGTDMENDQSLNRFMALMMVASKFMPEEQRRALEEWEVENIDGHTIGTSDWPGWEQIIGKLPKKFRKAEMTRP